MILIGTIVMMMTMMNLMNNVLQTLEWNHNFESGGFIASCDNLCANLESVCIVLFSIFIHPRSCG